MKIKHTIILAFVAYATNSYATPAVDMKAWESQTLGALFGTFCGYFQDSTTLVGRAEGISSYSQCKKRFDSYYPDCISKLKEKSSYSIKTPEEGKDIGSELGKCVGTKFDKDKGKP